MNNLYKRIVNRMNTLFFFFLLFSFYIIGKIIFIQNFESKDDLNITIETIKKVEIESSRGNIYSDNGDLIVSNISKYELRWDSKIPTSNLFDSNIDSLSKNLSIKFSNTKDYFKKSKEEILDKINLKEEQLTKNYNFSYYYLSIAAVFIGILIFYTIPFNNENLTEFDTNSPIISTLISGEEITNEYIIEFYSESIVLNEINFGN